MTSSLLRKVYGIYIHVRVVRVLCQGHIVHLSKGILVYRLEKAMAPHSSPLAGKSHGQRSLVGYSPWVEESDTTERLHFHFSLSCIGERNATHSSVLAWRIPRMVEPGRLPSMGSRRVRHTEVT